MRHTMPSIGGITWERLQREDSVTYPCEKEGDPGDSVVFIKSFPTPTGRAKFVPADIIPADERPDTEYPMVLITGRQLEHWHTGSMTRRSGVLDAIEPDAVAMLNPLDMAALGAKPGQLITIQSRRGKVSLYARADESSPHGAVFVPFCFYEAAINKLTNSALDPFGKIPEFKYCAVRLSLGGTPPKQSSFGGGQILEPSRQARIDLQFGQLTQGVGIRKRRRVIEYHLRSTILRGEEPGFALAAFDKGAQPVTQRCPHQAEYRLRPQFIRLARVRSRQFCIRIHEALRETYDQVGRKIRRIARHRDQVARAAMHKTREHAGERPGKVRHLILPNRDAHGLIRGQVAVGVEHQRGHLGPQAVQRVLRQRYA
jgi:formylmethanofuran dehydrogenase subunit D